MNLPRRRSMIRLLAAVPRGRNFHLRSEAEIKVSSCYSSLTRLTIESNGEAFSVTIRPGASVG